MTETTVVNISHRDLTGIVYIGRANRWQHLTASPFANPYRIGRDGTREEVLAKYRTYMLEHPDLVRRLPELRGQVLGCWCAPAACHGHILALYADVGCKYCGQPIWEHEYESMADGSRGQWEAGEGWTGHVFELPGEGP